MKTYRTLRPTLVQRLQALREAVMHQAFAVHALADTGLAQQVDHALFQDTGANALLDVVRRLAFDDHVADASVVQKLAEQQARGAGANNGNLGFQCFHCSYDSQAARGQSRCVVCINRVLAFFACESVN